MYLIIALATFPSIMIWIPGYNYSDMKIQWVAIMLVIFSLILPFYSLIDNRFSLKIGISVLITLPLLAIVFLSEIGASYGGGEREIINKVKFENYIAFQLEPKLYEKEKTLRIIKTQLGGFIEKTIFETWYLDNLTKPDCKYYFGDNNKKLIYDLCKKQLKAL